MDPKNNEQQSGKKMTPRLSQLPQRDKKRVYRRLAWWSGLAPFVAFLFTVYIWGILNLLTSASNTQSELVNLTTLVFIPFILAILPFTLPVGIILAVYFAFKAKRTPADPDIIKPKRSWWKTAGVAFFILLILILIPVITVSIATATYNKNNCGFGGCPPTTLPHINTVLKVPTVDLDETRSSDSRSQALNSLDKSNSDIESVINQSVDYITDFASFHQGIELESVSVNGNFAPGKNEFMGAEFTVEDKHIVISIKGTADKRADIMGVKNGGQVIGYVPQLRTAPSFEVIMPLSVLNTAEDIQFEILILVDTEMF